MGIIILINLKLSVGTKLMILILIISLKLRLYPRHKFNIKIINRSENYIFIFLLVRSTALFTLFVGRVSLIRFFSVVLILFSVIYTQVEISYMGINSIRFIYFSNLRYYLILIKILGREVNLNTIVIFSLY